MNPVFKRAWVYFAIIVLIPTAVCARVIHVPEDSLTIQGAMDLASDGDMVIVAVGLYRENIHFHGKNIIVRSTNPHLLSVVYDTVINGDINNDGEGDGPVVIFSGTESAACLLMGFTITNGRHTNGGGLCGNGTLATISNNQITGNYAMYTVHPSGNGGGIHDCDGLIEYNTFSGNTTDPDFGMGGGLYGCDGIIRNNRIQSNESSWGGGLAYCNAHIYLNSIGLNKALTGSMNGGGLLSCNGTIENNQIIGNQAGGWGGGISSCDGRIIRGNLIRLNQAYSGAGISSCGAVVENNIIVLNSAGGSVNSKGGGVFDCSVKVNNNTIYGNSSSGTGGGMEGCSGEIKNNIIWGNTAISGAQMKSCSLPYYCCVQNWTGGGTGTITQDPLLDPDDIIYHLPATSPCIDAG